MNKPRKTSQNNSLFRCYTEHGWFSQTAFLGHTLSIYDRNVLELSRGNIAEFRDALVDMLPRLPETAGVALYLYADSRAREPLKSRVYPGPIVFAEGSGANDDRIIVDYQRKSAMLELRLKFKHVSKSNELDLLVERIK